ncbi:MAG: YraN family protein [Desulfofustis sp.]|nr:YraN family protein [Desulfofustis sp.]NNK56239.1 YraN family protein [Desulfofustis sp.]RZW26924.1 MAG: YraN family protein [Desulfobulbaceae bacterium]
MGPVPSIDTASRESKSLSRKRINLGKRGEEVAAAYLRAKGYRIKARNYRQKTGEIDIICKDGDTHVFVEVKTRQHCEFGHPTEAVTRRKQMQISRTALLYLNIEELLDTPVRFDVIGVILKEWGPEISHIVGAFEAE